MGKIGTKPSLDFGNAEQKTGCPGGLNSNMHTGVDGLRRPFRMVLSAGQTSDHDGARARSGSCLRSRLCLAFAAMTPTGSVTHWNRVAFRLAFRPGGPGRCRSRMTRPSAGAVTGSRTPLPGTRTGAGWQRAMIAAPTLSSRPAPMQQSSCSGHESRLKAILAMSNTAFRFRIDWLGCAVHTIDPCDRRWVMKCILPWLSALSGSIHDSVAFVRCRFSSGLFLVDSGVHILPGLQLADGYVLEHIQ